MLKEKNNRMMVFLLVQENLEKIVHGVVTPQRK